MKINVLLLAAGKGSRFQNYSNIPKPFIKIANTTMFEYSLSYLNVDNEISTHCLFQEKDYDYYKNLSKFKIHTLNEYTNGAAESAYSVIKNYQKEAWLIMDCDAVIKTDKIKLGNESCIFVERESVFDPRASYSLIKNNEILCTAEKQVISKNRNVGIYYWSSGEIFCKSFEFCKFNDYKINNEYYISPLYNIAINFGEKVVPAYVNSFVPIGTPEDLESYLNEKNSTQR